MLRSQNPENGPKADCAFRSLIDAGIKIAVDENGLDEAQTLAALDKMASTFEDRWSSYQAMKIRAMVAAKFLEKNAEMAVPNDSDSHK